MTTENSTATDEAKIRALIEERAKAVRARDIDGAVADLAPDVVAFDVINPLQNKGADAVRKRIADWFSSFAGTTLGYEIAELSITTGDDVAFSHSLNQVKGTKADGQEIEMCWRATTCYRKIDGQWLVTHEHSSVPFDPETGKASLSLKP